MCQMQNVCTNAKDDKTYEPYDVIIVVYFEE